MTLLTSLGIRISIESLFTSLDTFFVRIEVVSFSALSTSSSIRTTFTLDTTGSTRGSVFIISYRTTHGTRVGLLCINWSIITSVTLVKHSSETSGTVFMTILTDHIILVMESSSRTFFKTSSSTLEITLLTDFTSISRSRTNFTCGVTLDTGCTCWILDKS